MSDWNRSSDDPNGGLDSLLAQLREQNGGSNSNAPPSSFLTQIAAQSNPYFTQAQQQPHSYGQHSTSSPLPMPPVYGQNSHHGSAVTSPTSETPNLPRPNPAGSSSADRSANLLKLLNFGSPTSNSPSAQINQHAIPQSSTSAQVLGPIGSKSSRGAPDLLATLMGTSMKENDKTISPRLPSTTQNEFQRADTAPSIPPVNTQEFLLGLLNRPKPAQTSAKPFLEPAKAPALSSKSEGQADVTDLTQRLEDASINQGLDNQSDRNQTVLKPTQGLFTYTNPFDELARSSPLNRTPKPSTPAAPTMQILKPPRHAAPENSDLKRKGDERDSTSSPAHSKRKLESSISTPSPQPEGRNEIDASVGSGSAGKGKETVTESLRGVGSQVDKQVEQAIARVEQEESHAAIERDLRNMMDARTEPEFKSTAQTAAVSLKKELEKEGNERALEDCLPTHVAEEVKTIVDDAARGDVADSWESADPEETNPKDSPKQVVKVYHFPLKPFISIALRPDVDPEISVFRDGSVFDIARLKKDFDQVDRTLATASLNFIAFAMKVAGVRIIRQIDGEDTKLFSESQDRVFSVALSYSSSDASETVLCTGVSGTIYWAPIRSQDGEDLVGHGESVKYAFTLPPIHVPGEESSGGVLKTRARKSSAHPEFFAVGRGKSIHIIQPYEIVKHGYLKEGLDRVVDIETYINERALKINTGKAGKDFTFSQDDTTVVSLDKAGRVKFWDVRNLTSPDRANGPLEVKEPLLTLITTPANEKSWPTSVLFVDKYRPYIKGGALRYLIVGMKQNHTLQLWDLALGKPVQELNLPHKKESDAVCSVMYHAPTGIIVVGHPTRNSIYFIHLSSPKYNLPKSITQAEFTEKYVSKDQSLPEPTSTAVMSGIREYSFENKGALRSLDILANPLSAAAHVDDPSLFELYAMHSRGVTSITVKVEDLGWDRENKVIAPLDADEAGLITVEGLKPILANESESYSTPSSTKSASRAIIKDSVSKDRKAAFSNGHPESNRTPSLPSSAASSARSAIKLESPQPSKLNGGQESGTSGAEKVDKKKKKRAAASASASGSMSLPMETHKRAPPTVPSPPITSSDAHDGQSGGLGTATNASLGNTESDISVHADVLNSSSEPTLSQEALAMVSKNLESNVNAEVSRLLTTSLENLYRRFDDDKRTQAAAADAKQDAMLRLISSTLSDNVEKTLGNIVNENIKKTVLPAVSEVTAKAVNDQLGTKLGAHLKSTLPRELQGVLPDAITKTLQKPEVLKLISESLVKSVAFRVEEQFANVLQKSIAPAFTALAVKAAQEASSGIQRQALEVIADIERERRDDRNKIDQLTRVVTGLTENITSMAATQALYQERLLEWSQRQSILEEQAASVDSSQARGLEHSSQPSQAVVPAKTEDEVQLKEVLRQIEEAMHRGNMEGAIIDWLRSDKTQEIFEAYFAKYQPTFIHNNDPLTLLATCMTVSQKLDGDFLLQRIDWIEYSLQAFQSTAHNLEKSVHDASSTLLPQLISRIEDLFMRISSHSAHDPLLKRLAIIVATAKRILGIVGSYRPSYS